MRASELLGQPVWTADGARLGQVVDVRLVQDGPLLGGFAALRIEGLVVGRHRVAGRLGYDRYDQPGPALVRLLAGWLTRHNGYLRWEDVRLEGTTVTATAAPGEIPPL
jgi:hypothetical protein